VIRPPSHPVFVASTGGHLEQLFLLAEKWGWLGQGRPWLTFDNEQSRSLLECEDVTYIPYVKPRDIRGTYASVAPIARAIRSHHVEDVVSTGAAVAISAAVAAEVTRKNFVYIESIARVTNLSLTGRLVQLMPHVERYVQHDDLKARRFHFAGSAMDSYRVVQSKGPAPVQKAFVTVGTIKPYKFERLFTRVQEQFPQLSISWQTGPADMARLPGKVRRSMSRAELLREMQEADVVITHAGVGSILSALRVGKVPVVVPRLARYHEHIDDHQIEIAKLLGNLGLVVVRDVDTLDMASLSFAAQHQVRTDCESGVAA
jgi:UDP-N-acetylglucosamine transferase subunit ALG13